MAEQITRLGEGTRSFQAGGRTYIVHESLTVDGFQRLEELRVEMEAGNGVGDMLKLTQKAYDLLNKGKVADAAVSLYNCLNIQERIVDGRPQAWLLALTLFIRPEGSDLASWTEAEATEWINEWSGAGLAVSDLFNLAYACRERLDTDFLASFPATSTAGTTRDAGGRAWAETTTGNGR